MTDPDVCRRCAAIHPTCCRHAAGEEQFCFPLPEAEYAALRRFGLSEEAFAREANTAAFVRHLARLFPGAPVDKAFPPDKSHRRLATRNGACTLLGPSGCTLPRRLRPLFCRIYPLWYHATQLTAFANPHCLAVHEAPSLRQLCRIIGTNPATVNKQVTQLRGLLFPKD